MERITNRDEWKASRAISNKLAAKLRAATATSAEEAEYRQRDEAEQAWMNAQPRPSWLSGKSCEELGLMP